MNKVMVGDLVAADILYGEICDGTAAGLLEGYTIEGVGLVDMALVYAPEELTDCYRPGDTCFAALVLEVP